MKLIRMDKFSDEVEHQDRLLGKSFCVIAHREIQFEGFEKC